jgi:hypothetical protein
MSRQQDLEDMHDLLQQMKDMHEMELHAPDHCEGIFHDWAEKAKKKIGTMRNKDFKTTAETLEAFFNASTEQRTLLTDFLNGTDNVKDVFNTLKVLVTADELVEIVHPGTPVSTTPVNVKVTNATNSYRAMVSNNGMTAKDLQRVILINILGKTTDHDAFNALKVVSSYRNEMIKIWKDKMNV